jgi:hypothetical protein
MRQPQTSGLPLWRFWDRRKLRDLVRELVRHRAAPSWTAESPDLPDEDGRAGRAWRRRHIATLLIEASIAAEERQDPSAEREAQKNSRKQAKRRSLKGDKAEMDVDLSLCGAAWDAAIALDAIAFGKRRRPHEVDWHRLRWVPYRRAQEAARGRGKAIVVFVEWARTHPLTEVLCAQIRDVRIPGGNRGWVSEMRELARAERARSPSG